MTHQNTITQQCNKDSAWHTQLTNEVLEQYQATAESYSARAREQRQGCTTNDTEEREIGNHVRSSRNFISQFENLIIWILMAAGVIFALLGERIEVIAVVVLNAIIVCYQEFNVEKRIQRFQ